jgi:adenosylhomocysteine nucleosidase
MLVASESRELAGIKDRDRWVMVVTGSGRESVMRVLREKPEVEGVISTGFCGALDPALEIGEILSWTESSGSRPLFVTTDQVIVTAKNKQALREKTGARVVDMESEAVAQKAAEWGLPFRYIRAVSDTADEDMPLDFNLYRTRDGNFSRFRIALAAARHPFTVAPGLLRLDRNCKLAAQKLGEFFVDCRL